MKFIHCADVHLDSKIEANLPPAAAKQRRKEILLTFCSMADYAQNNNVTAVIIAGDLFESIHANKTTAEIILKKIEECKDTDFLYLLGNHDYINPLSDYDCPENLKFFGNDWTSFNYGDTTITGVNLTADNYRSIYSSLMLDNSKLNIVTLHGQLSTSSSEININQNELNNCGIDYLALGHIHNQSSGKLGENGKWCYCGCLEGRGFDEAGDKGFVLIETEGKTFKTQFIKTNGRKIEVLECDISYLSDAGDILQKVDKDTSHIDKDSMLKLVLIGAVPADARKDLEYLNTHLNQKFWFAKIKDQTRLAICPEDYINDVSLKGEFIRLAMSQDLTDEMRDRIIECGLSALGGLEVQ